MDTVTVFFMHVRKFLNVLWSTVFILHLTVFLFCPTQSFAEILYENNFDDAPDWSSAPHISSICNTHETAGQLGFTSYRATDTMGDPLFTINSANGRGSSGKGLAVAVEARSNWAGGGLDIHFADPDSCGGKLKANVDPLGYEELFIRFYQKFQPGWNWGGAGPRFMKIFRAYSNVDYADKVSCCGDLSASFDCAGREMTSYIILDWQGTPNYMVNYRTEPSTATQQTQDYGCSWLDHFADGQWHCVEFHLKMNEIGSSNTIADVYIDGVKSGQLKSAQALRQSDDKRFNAFIMFDNHTIPATTPFEQKYFIDDLVISTRYIGPDGQNQAPVANAGPNQEVTDDDGDGQYVISLDGSGSYDPDGTITGYSWLENGQEIATGMNPSAAFSIGSHEVILRVSDNEGAIGSDTVNINVVAGGAPDVEAPAPVSDLAVGNVSSTYGILSWTATGDDGFVGAASAYDIRYSTAEITEANWDSASRASGMSTPQSSGSNETFYLTGLVPDTHYYIAMKVIDESGNISNLSNVINFTTNKASNELGVLAYWEADGEMLSVAAGAPQVTRSGNTAFVDGLKGFGFYVNVPRSWAEFSADGNIPEAKGSIELSIKPDWAHTDGEYHLLIQVGEGSRNEIKLWKATNNYLFYYLWDNAGHMHRVFIDPSKYSLDPEHWTAIRIRWDDSSQTDNLALYVNGDLKIRKDGDSWNQNRLNFADKKVYLGGSPETYASPMSGILDELIISGTEIDIPPSDVTNPHKVSLKGDSLTLGWTNPTSRDGSGDLIPENQDFEGVMIRYNVGSNASFPAKYTEGILFGDAPGNLDEDDSFTGTITVGQVYKFSFFSHDDKGHYSDTAHLLVDTTSSPPPDNVPPTINSFTGVPSTLNNPGETTTFNVSATDPDGDPLTYTISFGDGTPNGSGSQVVHTYETKGTYTAEVSVDDGHGNTVAESLQVTVNDIPPAEPTNVSAN